MGQTAPPRNNIQQAQHCRKAKRDDKVREKEAPKEATATYFAVKQGKVPKESAKAITERVITEVPKESVEAQEVTS